MRAVDGSPARRRARAESGGLVRCRRIVLAGAGLVLGEGFKPFFGLVAESRRSLAVKMAGCDPVDRGSNPGGGPFLSTRNGMRFALVFGQQGRPALFCKSTSCFYFVTYP